MGRVEPVEHLAEVIELYPLAGKSTEQLIFEADQIAEEIFKLEDSLKPYLDEIQRRKGTIA